MSHTLTEYEAGTNTVKYLYCGRNYNSNFATACPNCGSKHKRRLHHWEH